MALGFCCYYLMQTGRPVLRWLLVVLCVGLMVSARANALITLLPALFFLWLTEKKRLSAKRSMTLVIVAVIITGIAANTLIPGGILTAISERQKDFQSLQGGSRLYLPLLTPEWQSFLAVFPVAVLNGWLQPLPGTGGKLIYTAFSAELILIWFIIIGACGKLFSKKDRVFSHFDIFCVLYALPGLIIIGYIVPFAGAIIRYRCIYLPFLLAPFINVYCRYPANIWYSANAWLKRNVVAE